MLHRTRFVATLTATLLVFAASPSFAQQSASDSTRQQEVAAEEEEEARRWGVGVQLSPVFGLSVRRALTERLAVQAAGIPFLIGGETVAGARLLFKLYTQPHYSFHVSGGGSAFINTNDRTARDEEQETRVTPVYFGTLGGEYRFSRRLGLSGDVGLAYLQFEGRVITRNGVSPVLGLGLHYYL